MKASLRTRARELALKALYALECGDVEPGDDFSNIIDDESIPKETIEYARSLYDLVLQHLEWADDQIARLAENWALNRIAAIDRNILRMAMVELANLPDVPVKVVLNEAIELAKKFSSSQSSAFVNGILDSFAKKMEDRETT